MTHNWGRGNYTLGLILGLALGLQSACNDAGFQSGQTLTDDKAATAAPAKADAAAQSGDAT
jgi:hypothetical protein